jgi:hypothetical protein
MYVVRDVFKTKPGQAKDLVKKFDAALPHMQVDGIKARRILVDSVSAYWTVVLETEVEDLEAYFSLAENREAREQMSGYLDLVTGGHREIFKVAA